MHNQFLFALLILVISVSVCRSSSSGSGSDSHSNSGPEPSSVPNELTLSEREDVDIIYIFSKDAIVNDRKELCSLCLSKLARVEIAEDGLESDNTETSPFLGQPRIYTLLHNHMVSIDASELDPYDACSRGIVR